MSDFRLPPFTFFTKPQEVCPNCGGLFTLKAFCNDRECGHAYYPEGYPEEWGPRNMNEWPHSLKECASCEYRFWEKDKS